MSKDDSAAELLLGCSDDALQTGRKMSQKIGVYNFNQLVYKIYI